MAKRFARIEEVHRAFVEKQKIFFSASSTIILESRDSSWELATISEAILRSPRLSEHPWTIFA